MQPGQAQIPAEGYHEYFYSAEKKGYSGTAILAKREPLSVAYGMGSELHVHMPVPCAATNIYLMLGGKGAEDALGLDLTFLTAAQRVRLPGAQPLRIRLRRAADVVQIRRAERRDLADGKRHGQIERRLGHARGRQQGQRRAAAAQK